MVKGIACTVLVGSVAAMFACSSSSKSTVFTASDDSGTDDASSSNDSGSSGSSGSSSGSSSGGACSASSLSLPAACKTCVTTNCSAQLAACTTCDITCAETCTTCASACLGGGTDSGTTTPKDSGSASGDGGDPCGKLTSCGGCTLVTAGGLDNPATPCASSVSSDNTAACQTYLTGLQAAGLCK